MSDRSTITSALVIVDLARDFVYPGGTIADAGGPEYQARAQEIIPRLAHLIEAARRSGVVVAYATDAHGCEDSELSKWPPHAMKGTEWAQIVEPLAPQVGDVVMEKTTYSPFVSTDIRQELRRRGVTRLYMTGLHTDCCVRHTSGDAFQNGLDLVWISDAMQAFSDEAHTAGLEYFKAWYATDSDRQFRTTEQVLEAWGAGVPV